MEGIDMHYNTEQEDFWAGEFGSEYVSRNNDDNLATSKLIMWSKILSATSGINSVCELGCNIGLNLLAIKGIFNNIQLYGVEINSEAARQAKSYGLENIKNCSISDFDMQKKVDLVFTVGVLIHINPEILEEVYEKLFQLTRRYIVVAEYYSPTPQMIEYRGHKDRLFKRDFAGEIINKFKLELIDYGFFYHRDKLAPLDDITWFLLEKKI